MKRKLDIIEANWFYVILSVLARIVLYAYLYNTMIY